MRKPHDEGFVLITTLVLIVVLTILGIGLYYRSVVNQQVSALSLQTTKAEYYAESAINYVTWALYRDPDARDPYSAWDHDLDLDSHTSGTIAEDRAALQASPESPDVQLLYFDNRPVNLRDVVFDPYTYPTKGYKDFTLATIGLPAEPYGGYLLFEADTSTGMLQDPYAFRLPSTQPLTNTEPQNGAVLWLTAADAISNNAIFDGADIEARNLDEYDLIAYAIGYVNGKRLRLFRARIGRVAPSAPIGLGSVTNARD